MDFDYKKKRQGKVPDEEIRQAVEKFDESKELAEKSMFNFLENDVRDRIKLLNEEQTNRQSGICLFITGVCSFCDSGVTQTKGLRALPAPRTAAWIH